MDHAELQHRFAYHPPTSDHVRMLHEQIRSSLHEVADELSHLLPECRETSLAITRLEEATMWANAAIARNQGLLANSKTSEGA